MPSPSVLSPNYLIGHIFQGSFCICPLCPYFENLLLVRLAVLIQKESISTLLQTFVFITILWWVFSSPSPSLHNTIPPLYDKWNE